MFAILTQVAAAALAMWGVGQDERDVGAAILATYCFDCHSGARPAAQLDLERRVGVDPRLDDRVAWLRVTERVRLGEMPPIDAPQPSDDERDQLVKWIEARSRAIVRPSPARGVRRLTRSEYDHTVRDLIGLDLHLAERLLPPDAGGGEGFDNCADTLYLPPLMMEGFLDAARLILDEAVIESPTGIPDPARGDSDSRLAMHRTVVIATPSPTLPERATAEEITRRFLRRAFRRTPRETDVDRALLRFTSARADGGSFTGAIRTMLLPILVSPRFLFRVDQPDDSFRPSVSLDEKHRIDDFSLASRLSYFLWASMPDDELLDVAQVNLLRIPDVLASQVDRMLDDPRQRGLSETFASQWLGIRELADHHPPDADRFPDVDRPLLLDMVEEAIVTFSSLIEEDASLLQLIDSDAVYVNDRLANHYHISLAPSAEADLTPLPPATFRRVEVTDQSRGGVLGMGSVLRVSSLPLRTSPVLRGKWILETLLGAPPPPPPPNAGALPPDDRLADGLSPRERLERHRAEPGCASCHDQIDPLGFALESFDAVGRRRTTQFGLPIDDLFDWNGRSGRGVDDLKAALLDRRDAFSRHFIRQLLGYALGRPLDELDRPLVEQLTAKLPDHAYSIRWLIHQIVQSEAFGST